MGGGEGTKNQNHDNITLEIKTKLNLATYFNYENIIYHNTKLSPFENVDIKDDTNFEYILDEDKYSVHTGDVLMIKFNWACIPGMVVNREHNRFLKTKAGKPSYTYEIITIERTRHFIDTEALKVYRIKDLKLQKTIKDYFSSLLLEIN